MAILSDYVEEPHPQPQQQQQNRSFTGVLDSSNPLRFRQSAFDFVSNETDFFNNDSAEKDLVALVRALKEKERAKLESKNNRQREEPASASNSQKTEEKNKDVAPTEEDKKEEKSKYLGNGLDLAKYSWTQSLQEVNVNIPVPPGAKTRLLYVTSRRTI